MSGALKLLIALFCSESKGGNSGGEGTESGEDGGGALSSDDDGDVLLDGLALRISLLRVPDTLNVLALVSPDLAALRVVSSDASSEDLLSCVHRGDRCVELSIGWFEVLAFVDGPRRGALLVVDLGRWIVTVVVELFRDAFTVQLESINVRTELVVLELVDPESPDLLPVAPSVPKICLDSPIVISEGSGGSGGLAQPLLEASVGLGPPSPAASSDGVASVGNGGTIPGLLGTVTWSNDSFLDSNGHVLDRTLASAFAFIVGVDTHVARRRDAGLVDGRGLDSRVGSRERASELLAVDSGGGVLELRFCGFTDRLGWGNVVSGLL